MRFASAPGRGPFGSRSDYLAGAVGVRVFGCVLGLPTRNEVIAGAVDSHLRKREHQGGRLRAVPVKCFRLLALPLGSSKKNFPVALSGLLAKPCQLPRGR